MLGPGSIRRGPGNRSLPAGHGNRLSHSGCRSRGGIDAAGRWGQGEQMSETPPPAVTLSATTVGAPDPRALADFYRRLLDWDVVEDEPDWVTLRPPGGGHGLSFQTEADYVPPTWPATEGRQQMTMHLDLRVEDLEVAARHAEACGATVAEHQPQEGVRVCLDPVGHPFCLFLPGA